MTTQWDDGRYEVTLVEAVIVESNQGTPQLEILVERVNDGARKRGWLFVLSQDGAPNVKLLDTMEALGAGGWEDLSGAIGADATVKVVDGYVRYIDAPRAGTEGNSELAAKMAKLFAEARETAPADPPARQSGAPRQSRQARTTTPARQAPPAPRASDDDVPF